MREIKYRAWDIITLQMRPVVLLQFSTGGSLEWVVVDEGEGTPDTYIPLEYTGLKDKNGAEGYYTDILNASFQDNWVVDWDEDEGNYYLRSLLGYDPLPLRKMKDMVIIGNIWENHELLEAKEYDK